MSSRAAARLAWCLAGLCTVVFVATIPLWVLARSAPVPESWDANLTVANMLGHAPFLAFPLVGALIASRRPRNPIGWLLLTVGLLWMLIGASDYYSIYGVAQPGSAPFPVGVAGITNWLWVPAVGLPGTYLFLLFPGGRLPSRGWRPLAWLSGAVILLASAGFALAPEPLDILGGVPNPFGLEGQPWVASVGYVVLLLPLCMLASACSLVLRYRRSGGEERQQIKWIAFAASVVGVSYLIFMVSAFIFPSGAWFVAGSPLWMDLIAYGALLSFTLVPTAVGFAVLRYRLYDIDLLINRALVYGSLTATLILVYLGGVAAAQTVFRSLTGEEQQPQLAVVVSTLAIAALFNPLRRRLQAFVDRRFYRQKYDAARVLSAFSERLRDETELDTLIEDLMSVAEDTVQPAHVSLWLRPAEGDHSSAGGGNRED